MKIEFVRKQIALSMLLVGVVVLCIAPQVHANFDPIFGENEGGSFAEEDKRKEGNPCKEKPCNEETTRSPVGNGQESISLTNQCDCVEFPPGCKDDPVIPCSEIQNIGTNEIVVEFEDGTLKKIDLKSSSCTFLGNGDNYSFTLTGNDTSGVSFQYDGTGMLTICVDQFGGGGGPSLIDLGSGGHKIIYQSFLPIRAGGIHIKGSSNVTSILVDDPIPPSPNNPVRIEGLWSVRNPAPGDSCS